jgi:hypothetical protein
MSRGLGWVQRACLDAIAVYEANYKTEKVLPTTYNITADVYQVERDEDDNRWVNNAQHSAVKRALKRLEKQGHITWMIKKDGDWRVRCWVTLQGAVLLGLMSEEDAAAEVAEDARPSGDEDD